MAYCNDSRQPSQDSEYAKSEDHPRFLHCHSRLSKPPTSGQMTSCSNRRYGFAEILSNPERGITRSQSFNFWFAPLALSAYLTSLPFQRSQASIAMASATSHGANL
jgi:hypothetical protein